MGTSPVLAESAFKGPAARGRRDTERCTVAQETLCCRYSRARVSGLASYTTPGPGQPGESANKQVLFTPSRQLMAGWLSQCPTHQTNVTAAIM